MYLCFSIFPEVCRPQGFQGGHMKESANKSLLSMLKACSHTAAMEFTASPGPEWSSRTVMMRWRVVSRIPSAYLSLPSGVSGSGGWSDGVIACLYRRWSLQSRNSVKVKGLTLKHNVDG